MSFRLAIVAGEPSGDALGAAIVRALREREPALSLVGVGGPALQSAGLDTLFDPDEIAIVGVTAVLARLPRLVRLIGDTARRIAAADPDVVVLIDSPDFTHRVAAKLRVRRPELPIVKVVAPTVWAWRPERAGALRPLVDEVLAIFPHEPEWMARLGGPPTTFIGHPLMDEPRLQRSTAAATEPNLLVLPGSRRSEIERLAPIFGEALGVLQRRGVAFRPVLPMLERRAGLIGRVTAKWPVAANVVVGEEARFAAFRTGRAAIAASGTVTLELALANVPTVAAYRIDALERQIAKRITAWAMAMPNIIADRVVVDELLNDTVRPERIARLTERLLADTPERTAQLDGFEEVRRRLRTERPAAENAADRILDLANDGRQRRSMGT